MTEFPLSHRLPPRAARPFRSCGAGRYQPLAWGEQQNPARSFALKLVPHSRSPFSCFLTQVGRHTRPDARTYGWRPNERSTPQSNCRSTGTWPRGGREPIFTLLRGGLICQTDDTFLGCYCRCALKQVQLRLDRKNPRQSARSLISPVMAGSTIAPQAGEEERGLPVCLKETRLITRVSYHAGSRHDARSVPA